MALQFDRNTLKSMCLYNDWANGQLLDAAKPVGDEKLDQPFDMGFGSLRATLMHTYVAEHVWLQRWQGNTEAPWLDDQEKVAMSDLATRFEKHYIARDQFLGRLTEDAFSESRSYLDSRGGYFTASLGEMIYQTFVHSIHHRAQAVNMLRRLDAEPPELDYVMWRRKPR